MHTDKLDTTPRLPFIVTVTACHPDCEANSFVRENPAVPIEFWSHRPWCPVHEFEGDGVR